MQFQWRRQVTVWRRVPISPPPPRPQRGPDSVRFEVVYDEDQGKLAGLPFYGFAARAQFINEPPPDFDFEELAEWGRAAVVDNLNELCQRLMLDLYD